MESQRVSLSSGKPRGSVFFTPFLISGISCDGGKGIESDKADTAQFLSERVQCALNFLGGFRRGLAVAVCVL